MRRTFALMRPLVVSCLLVISALPDGVKVARAGNPAIDGTWSLAPGPYPPRRYGASLVYDPTRHRMILFGGYGLATSTYLNDTWALSLDGAPQWTQLSTSGDPPQGRYYHAAACDPNSDRLFVHGGRRPSTFLDDLWSLDLSTNVWVHLSGSDPGIRSNHGAALDPLRNRVLFFGGWCISPDSVACACNDVWALDLGSLLWTQVTAPPSPRPQERRDHAFLYDPPRDRFLVVGGWSCYGLPGIPDGALTDIWALTGSQPTTWTRLLSNLNYFDSLVAGYDGLRQRLVLFLRFGSQRTIQAIYLPTLNKVNLQPDGTGPTSSLYAVAYDPPNDRLVCLESSLGQTWLLTWSGVSAVPEGKASGRWFAGCRPNPFRTSTTFEFRLLRTETIALVIHDISGHLVRDLFQGTMPEGKHSVSWDGLNQTGNPMPDGIYFARLSTTSEQATQKILRWSQR
jgi:hypothetical protein